MKKTALAAIAIALCMLLFGCTARVVPPASSLPTAAPGEEYRRKTEEPALPTETDPEIKTFSPEQINADLAPLYYDVIRTSGGAVSGSSYKVYYDYESFAADFGDISAATGDRYTKGSFEKMFVVAVKMTVNTGGWTVDLDRAARDHNKVMVEVRMDPPSPEMNVTQAFETKCVLVAFGNENIDRGAMEFGVTVNGAAPTGFGDDI